MSKPNVKKIRDTLTLWNETVEEVARLKAQLETTERCLADIEAKAHNELAAIGMKGGLTFGDGLFVEATNKVSAAPLKENKGKVYDLVEFHNPKIVKYTFTFFGNEKTDIDRFAEATGKSPERKIEASTLSKYVRENAVPKDLFNVKETKSIKVKGVEKLSSNVTLS